MVVSPCSYKPLVDCGQNETTDIVHDNPNAAMRRWTMRFSMRIAISVFLGTVLLAIRGLGIGGRVDADERAERRSERYETIGPNDPAAITTVQAIAAALTVHPNTTAVETTLAKERGMLLYSVKLKTGEEVK